MASIAPHLSLAELEQRYRGATAAIEKSHYHAIWLLAQGYEVGEVAKLLAFSTRWVELLAQRYNAGGPARLGDQRAKNGTEPTILTPEALAGLKEGLARAPDEGGVWTAPKIALEYSLQQPRPRHPAAAGEAARTALKKLAEAAREEQSRHPQATVEIWATDEHRLGLKPVARRVWAPCCERPIAIGHHRFEWLYLAGFVEPATGRTVWNISNAICKPLFAAILADFAKSVGAGPTKRIILQLDNAGWHGPKNLPVPEGVRLVYQPPNSPELQPAEHLWALVDEPLANRYFRTLRHLNRAVARRCRQLIGHADTIRRSTLFHWWPAKRT